MWGIGNHKKPGEQDLTDEELLTRHRLSGDMNYVGILFTRYTHLVYGVCMKYLRDEEDARDAVMDIFEALLQKVHDYRVETFKNWLYAVSKNHCLMVLRKEASVLKVREQWMAVFSQEFMDSAEVMHLDKDDLDTRLSKMFDALKRLNDEQRTCIELLYLHNKTYQEVAEKTGYTMNQVKSFIQNGKRNMKIILQKE